MRRISQDSCKRARQIARPHIEEEPGAEPLAGIPGKRCELCRDTIRIADTGNWHEQEIFRRSDQLHALLQKSARSGKWRGDQTSDDDGFPSRRFAGYSNYVEQRRLV